MKGKSNSNLKGAIEFEIKKETYNSTFKGQLTIEANTKINFGILNGKLQAGVKNNNYNPKLQLIVTFEIAKEK